MPDNTQYIQVEPGLDAISAQLRAGDLAIVPGAILRRAIGSDAQRLVDTIAGISLIVTAGPYRLNLTSAAVSPEVKAALPMSRSG